MAHKAVQIADFLVEQAIRDQSGDLLTNLKLQKLLYYAEGCHLAVHGSSLFSDRIEAWEMGPVIPDVYHRFKPCGRLPIEEPYSDVIKLAEPTQAFLLEICSVFGRFSASQLVAMTHNETPWLKTYRKSKNVEISKVMIQEFFSKRWKNIFQEYPDDKFGEYEPAFAGALCAALAEVDKHDHGMSADDLLLALNIQ